MKIRREIRQMIRIDEFDRYVKIEEKFKIDFHEPRLNFNLCSIRGTEKVEFWYKYTYLFWKPDFDTPRETLFKPSFDRVVLYQNGKMKYWGTRQ